MICKNCKIEITSENKTKAYASLCKSCHAQFKRKEYKKNPNKKIVSVKRYQVSEHGKEVAKSTNKRMYAKNPERQKARSRLRYAVRIGKIVKPDVCDESKFKGCTPCNGRIEAHHGRGYIGDHALDVLWLCKKHHVEAHEKEEE